MTYLPSASKAFLDCSHAADAEAHSSTPKAEAPRKAFFASIFDAIWTARQRQADAEIARYLAVSGGKLTDGAEREIERRFGRENFRPY